MFAEKNHSQIMYEKHENLYLFFKVCCYIAEHSFYVGLYTRYVQFTRTS